MYYHLSPNSGAKRIIASGSKRDPHDFAPRIPDQSHGEVQTPRICVAPTVWQCLLSNPRSERLYVYAVGVDKAESAEGKNITDLALTDEAWITDEVVRREGRRDRPTRAGLVTLEWPLPQGKDGDA